MAATLPAVLGIWSKEQTAIEAGVEHDSAGTFDLEVSMAVLGDLGGHRRTVDSAVAGRSGRSARYRRDGKSARR